jgi:hypothetical protein
MCVLQKSLTPCTLTVPHLALVVVKEQLGAVTAAATVSGAYPPHGAPPHTTYLDDLNARLAAVFDDAAAEQVRYVQRRLASIGLEVNFRKSRAIAKRGHTFSVEESRVVYREQSVGNRYYRELHGSVFGNTAVLPRYHGIAVYCGIPR